MKHEAHTPADVLVHHLFDQAALSHQGAIALIKGESQLSYDQLHQRTHCLAQTIQRSAPEVMLLGLSSTRSFDMISGLLATLQAGKAYLPLDPTQPPARLQRIIASARLTTCLASQAEAPFFQDLGLEVILLDEEYNDFAPFAAAHGILLMCSTLLVLRVSPKVCA